MCLTPMGCAHPSLCFFVLDSVIIGMLKDEKEEKYGVEKKGEK